MKLNSPTTRILAGLLSGLVLGIVCADAGVSWLEGAVAPLVDERPDWGPRIVIGASWRAIVNRRFFAAMEERLGLVQQVA